MPPKDIKQPLPKEVGLPNHPPEATQDQKIPQIPQRVFIPAPLSEFSRKFLQH